MRNRNLLPMHIWSVTSKHRRTSVRTAAADRPHLHPRRMFVTLNDAVALIVFNSGCKRMSSCVFFLLSIKAVREKKCQRSLFIRAWSKARCWIFLQMRCYGDKYLSESTLHSNNDVTWSGTWRYERLPVILTALHYQIQSIHMATVKRGWSNQIK